MSIKQQEVVASHQAFSKLALIDIHEITQRGEILHYPKGYTIYQQGEPLDALYFLLKGEIVLQTQYENREWTVTHLTANQGSFGWNEQETVSPYNTQVISEEATLFKIDKIALKQIFIEHPNLAKHLFIYRLPLGAALFFHAFEITNVQKIPQELLDAFQLAFFHAGETIVKEGEEATRFYMIAAGSAKVATESQDHHQVVKNFLETGDFFGEIGLLQDTIRKATVTATTDMALLSLEKSTFKHFLETPIGKQVQQILGERIKTYAFEETLMIGSDPECKLRIKGPGIADKHAKLIKTIEKNENISYSIKPLANLSQYKIFINKQPIIKETHLQVHDELFIGNYEIIIDHKRNTIQARETGHHSLYVENLFYSIKNQVLLEYISFSAYSGELVSIMGPSGSGKSTLMDLIYGSRKPKSGYVLYDRVSLYENLEFYRDIFGFVPQDDILLNELTIFENLYFAAKLREPLASREKLEAKIDAVLTLLKLAEKKHCRVGGGGEQQKVLSGGERKRVNIARELVFEPHVLFLDEPTSGLSSKDAEEVVGFLRQLADMGKLVITVLHQPNSDIFKMFDRVILLDKGGKLVFAGAAMECIRYMKEVVYDQTEVICTECDECKPDMIFDVMEKRNGDNKRIYSPEFWQERFESRQGYLFEEEKKKATLKQEISPSFQSHHLTPREHWGQFLTLVRRHLAKKINNRTNMLISMSSPLVISFLIAFIMRYTAENEPLYTFSGNILIPEYLFLAVIVSVFLGLTGSARDIVGEQAIYNREIKIKLKNPWYVLSKFTVLAIIAAVQVALFILVGNTVLEIRGVFWPFFLYLYLAALCGAAFGLLLSSIFRTAESVVNWIPMVLIPQIIFGGALVEFKEMNQQLFLNRADQVVPEICQLMPSRWAYEALVVTQVTMNPRDRSIREINHQREILIKKLDTQDPGHTSEKENEALENQLVALDERMAEIEPLYDARYYTNTKISQAVTDGNGNYLARKAEHQQKLGGFWFNSTFLSDRKSLVLGGEKSTIWEFSTQLFNIWILLLAIGLYLSGCMAVLYVKQRKTL